ncbi:DNA-protecting protein DprA [candidate division WOR-3 bacterium JGI_Cruoil_03_51_56]|uniref:DNA-protecting protein DprA n=1 Tax=candidate division WOR-3 bacterium JGI_Cruoil_03_51_56 TaxID=1973747 RepID=A0A235BYU1_UNCW3|nr:MAG: DNA-protecting protein DprA [candidate division WOR-3 bacterium JGI_Cruoil_03_51_56]
MGKTDVLREAFIDLYAVPRMTEARLRRLLERFGEPEEILKAGSHDIVEIDGIDSELAAAISSYRRSSETDKRIKNAKSLGVKTVSYQDEGFPANLKELKQMPPVLFVRGEVKDDDRLAIAIVGTRRLTYYGRQVAEKLAWKLAQHSVTVVSGLARGIDTWAHRGALAAGGRTLAVLGCGIDVYYPPENQKLYENISEHGAVLSEFTLGMEPLAMNFPKRNRIVSGLSKGVVAVEAGERSGVLNTVAWAADQGRDVFAVPGRIIDRTSVGTNRLLRDGARIVTSAKDILQELGVALHLEERAKISVAEDEKPVLEFLSGDPLHVDEICQGLGIPMAKLLGVLMQLEVKGLVRQLPGKFFVKRI